MGLGWQLHPIPTTHKKFSKKTSETLSSLYVAEWWKLGCLGQLSIAIIVVASKDAANEARFDLGL
jgi:hypothetical protein